MVDIIGPLLSVPEEHNIALKSKDDHLPDDHVKLVKSYKADLNLPTSPILPENYCSMKLLQLMMREVKVMWDLIETIKTTRPTTNGHSWIVYEKLFKGSPRKKRPTIFRQQTSRSSYYQGNFQHNATRDPPRAVWDEVSRGIYLVASHLPRDLPSREVL